MIQLQRTAGNRSVVRLVRSGHVAVQRKPTFAGLKEAVGGKKQSPTLKATKAAGKASKAKIATLDDLEKQVTRLESVTKKLVKAHQPGNADSQAAAFTVKESAERILGNMPEQNSKAWKLLGPKYPDEVRRLRRVIDDTQVIYDEMRVESSKREAGQVYMKAGRARGRAGGFAHLGHSAGFTKQLGPPPKPSAALQGWMSENNVTEYEAEWDQIQTAPHAEHVIFKGRDIAMYAYVDKMKQRRAGAAAGLSPAEFAAIQTYTDADYKYINPAAANDQAWMKGTYFEAVDVLDTGVATQEGWATLQDSLDKTGQTLDERKAKRVKDLTSRREEGALHTGMALQALRKLPVWGNKTAYRGQMMSKENFEEQFVQDADGTFRAKTGTVGWKTITSISKDRKVAAHWSGVGTGAYETIWEMEVTDGRDIEELSVNRVEREVALLPGAEFAVQSVQVNKEGGVVPNFGWVNWRLTIKCKQTK